MLISGSSAGNGAAMRIAPLAFHVDPALAQDRQVIRDVCRITHHNDEAYVGALAIVGAVRSLAFNSSTPDQLFRTSWGICQTRVCGTEFWNLAHFLMS